MSILIVFIQHFKVTTYIVYFPPRPVSVSVTTPVTISWVWNEDEFLSSESVNATSSFEEIQDQFLSFGCQFCLVLGRSVLVFRMSPFVSSEISSQVCVGGLYNFSTTCMQISTELRPNEFLQTWWLVVLLESLEKKNILTTCCKFSVHQ